jgi:hypothetical protein
MNYELDEWIWVDIKINLKWYDFKEIFKK